MILALYVGGFMEQLFMESAVRLAPIDTIRHGISSVAGIQCSIVAFILFGAVAGLIIWRGSGKEAYDERNFEVSSKGTYGTAGFMDEEERAQVLQSEKSFEKVDGVIFGRNLQDEKIISLQVESRLNRNFAVCGSQGSMKSRAFARVMALQCIRRGESVYLTDPKSELYEDLSFYFRESGYTVKQLNLIQLEHSDAWNCLGEIDDGSLIDVFCDVVIRNTTDKFDHFYDNTEMDLLKALCLYVFHEYPPEKRTFPEAYKLLINKSVDMLDAIFDRLPTHHPARGPYQLFAKAEKVKGNAVLGLGTRLQIMQNKLVQQITSHDEIDLSLPGREKCAYFCITSDQDSTFDMLATLFTSFLSIKLVRYADRTKERRLPVPVQFILDEFPNLGVVPDFKKKLATARSRGIGMSILFQNIPQLQNRYPDNQWEEILGGCDFSIFLGCNDMTTASYYSDRTGEITVSVSSIRKSYYTIRATDYVPEYTESTSLGKRMLLLPDEILRFPLDQGLLIIRGQKVCRFRKMDYLEHPDSQYMKLEKVEEHIPEWFKDWKQEKQNFKIYAEKEPDLPDKKEGGTEVGNPLTLDTEIKKTEKQANAKTSEQQEEKRIMKVEELFAFETSDGKEG
ncbi:VirD4-like conjugal transfer protein, CD1115 family [Blautia hydrogenotrophica]|uniref:VirD4-like conjugal transfer protein, CD1115 family n=1 Tax=Blautia hydrogenotrophica TaxID=53443 RepID=UPI002E7A2A75|nr:type IV secretory system conjugative DNA transfer family protein [Blautia hydrogenotrophica]